MSSGGEHSRLESMHRTDLLIKPRLPRIVISIVLGTSQFGLFSFAHKVQSLNSLAPL
jgi:hypothetical protein